MLGNLLCWLGLHQVVVTKPGADVVTEFGVRYTSSAYGACARLPCNKQYQWDH